VLFAIPLFCSVENRPAKLVGGSLFLTMGLKSETGLEITLVVNGFEADGCLVLFGCGVGKAS